MAQLSNKKAQEINDFFNNMYNNKFKKEYETSKSNIELIFGEHWTAEEIRKHEIEDRVAVNLPLLFRLVMIMLGYEKQNRNTIATEPQSVEDELLCFMNNIALLHIQNINKPVKYDYVKSDLFLEGTVARYGVCEIVHEENALATSSIYIKHLPCNQVLFDTNFTDYGMDGCSRIQYFEDRYLEDLKQEFPDVKEEVWRRITENVLLNDNSKLQIPVEAYNKDQENKDKIIARVIIDQNRVNKTYYECMSVEDESLPSYEFDNKKEADAHSSANAGYKTTEKVKRVIERTVVCQNEILEDTRLNDIEDEFSTTLYFSIWLQGRWATVVDVTRDLQRYWDRIFSQADYNIGISAKTVYEINKTRIDPDQTDEQVNEVVAKGGILWKNTDAKVLEIAQSKGTDPQYFQIFEMLMKIAEDTYGGKNFQGIQQYSGQSGKAIERLQNAAMVLSTNYIDNLNRFEEQLGRKLIKYIRKFFNAPIKQKIIGSYKNKAIIELLKSNQMYQQSMIEDGVGYISLNDPKNPASNIQKDPALEFTITQKSGAEVKRQEDFQKLMLYKQNGGVVPAEIWAEYFDFDPLLKNILIQANNQAMELQRQQTIEQEKTSRLEAMSKGLAPMQKMAQAGMEQAQGMGEDGDSEAE